MKKIKRDQKDLEKALLDRLDNLSEQISDYKAGKKSRMKDMAVNLRVLLVKTRTNNALLLDLAEMNRVDLVYNYFGPPIIGRKEIYTINELLNKTAFLSNVPTKVSLTYRELIKDIADQEGAHEDMSFSESLHRAKNSGIYVQNIAACDLSILKFAEIILLSSQPLYQKLMSK